MTKDETVRYLDTLVGQANTLARLYQEMLETIAGFQTEAEYQAAAAETFQTEQELIDMMATCRFDAES